ncbi:MAG: hypothetical protein M9904_02285 [Chitinophagaceae bacterium]|nr:hypothetical protein [Chitinophagaceae bacterium]
MKIELVKNKWYVNGTLWGKKKENDLGDQVLNILFYKNRDGNNEYILIINGVEETNDFKKQVKEKYSGIPNQDLAQRYF